MQHERRVMSTQLSKRALFSKGALSAGVGLGALALWAQRASADTPFTTFAFPATGAPTPRTMPDRLAEVVNVKDFGATGNGSTDDTAAIQAAIDHAMSHHRYTVYMPEGTYKTSDTIHLGYGWIAGAQNMNTISLVGANKYHIQASAPYEAYTMIKATFKDRPIINIQGARGSSVRNLAVMGPTTIPDAASQTLAWRANAANYVPAGAKDDSKAPFCGICVDGYAEGTAPDPITPPNPYPRPPYPFWVGTPPQIYGGGHSSDVVIDGCYINSTLIGVMIMPYGDGNGEFGQTKNCYIANQKIGVCWGNSQARQADLQNMYLTNVHTCFQATGYGRGIGQFAGNWDNICCDRTYRLLLGSDGWHEPFSISNYYVELGMIIGSGVQGVTFYNCMFGGQDFVTNGSNKLREFYNVPFFIGDAKFIGCKFQNQTAYKFVGNCLFEHCIFDGPQGNDGFTVWSSAKRAALNAFHGVFISCSHASDTAPTADCPFTSCRVYGNSLGHTQTEQSRCYFDGHDHYYMQSVYSKGQEHDLLYDIPSMKRIGIIFLGNVSLNGDTMMATPDYHTAGSFRPGDVLFNSTHGWWYVESQGAGPAYTITCKPLTDAAYDGTTWRILDST